MTQKSDAGSKQANWGQIVPIKELTSVVFLKSTNEVTEAAKITSIDPQLKTTKATPINTNQHTITGAKYKLVSPTGEFTVGFKSSPENITHTKIITERESVTS